jgi:hypothetical protein
MVVNLQTNYSFKVNHLSTTHKSRYFYQTHVDAIRTSTQVNGLNNNLYSRFNFVSSKNSSKKLGLTGVESGGSPDPEMVEEAVGIPTQENGEPDYIAQLEAAATSGELQKKLKTFDPSSLSSSQLSQYFGSSGFDANKPTTAHNYGGVTININAAAANANEIYKIIEKMLTEGALMQAAAGK